eukprot:767221-Hanusia_phi.AAC.5
MAMAAMAAMAAVVIEGAAGFSYPSGSLTTSANMPLLKSTCQTGLSSKTARRPGKCFLAGLNAKLDGDSSLQDRRSFLQLAVFLSSVATSRGVEFELELLNLRTVCEGVLAEEESNQKITANKKYQGPSAYGFSFNYPKSWKPNKKIGNKHLYDLEVRADDVASNDVDVAMSVFDLIIRNVCLGMLWFDRGNQVKSEKNKDAFLEVTIDHVEINSLKDFGTIDQLLPMRESCADPEEQEGRDCESCQGVRAGGQEAGDELLCDRARCIPSPLLSSPLLSSPLPSSPLLSSPLPSSPFLSLPLLSSPLGSALPRSPPLSFSPFPFLSLPIPDLRLPWLVTKNSAESERDRIISKLAITAQQQRPTIRGARSSCWTRRGGEERLREEMDEEDDDDDDEEEGEEEEEDERDDDEEEEVEEGG